MSRRTNPAVEGSLATDVYASAAVSKICCNGQMAGIRPVAREDPSIPGLGATRVNMLIPIVQS